MWSVVDRRGGGGGSKQNTQSSSWILTKHSPALNYHYLVQVVLNFVTSRSITSRVVKPHFTTFQENKTSLETPRKGHFQ